MNHRKNLILGSVMILSSLGLLAYAHYLQKESKKKVESLWEERFHNLAHRTLEIVCDLERFERPDVDVAQLQADVEFTIVTAAEY